MIDGAARRARRRRRPAGRRRHRTNMNVNEVLANRALQLLGRPLGDYARVSPLDDVNLHQSHQRHLPDGPAGRGHPAAARASRRRSSRCRRRSRPKEQEFAHVVKIGRTRVQDAVLTTLGREMGAYAEALGRDRWRIYKCEERLRVVNLGGTAIGTGLAAPRQYIFRVVDALREITGLGLARAENLVEATQNADVFVEVSGILKACAANLLKIANDLRLLSLRARRRARRDPPAAAAGRLVDHAGQGQPGDPRGGRPGGHARDGPRPGDRQAAALGQPGTEPVPAAGRRQPAREPRPAGAAPARSSRAHCVAGIEADEARCRAPRRQRDARRPRRSCRQIGYDARQRRSRRGAGSRARRIRDVVDRARLADGRASSTSCTSPEAVCRLGIAARQHGRSVKRRGGAMSRWHAPRLAAAHRPLRPPQRRQVVAAERA